MASGWLARQLSLAWLLGAAAQLQQATLWPGGLYATLALGVALLLGAGRRWRVRLPQGWAAPVLAVAVATLAFSWGGLLAGMRQQGLSPALEGRDLDVQGVVLAMPQRQDAGWRFRFRIEHAAWQGQRVAVPQQVYLGWYSASSRDEPAAALPEPVQAGERWRLRVRLKAAHGHINPRGFDYELWLWEQGITATGYVRQGRADPAPQRLGQSWRHPLEWWRQQVRERMLQRLAGSGGSASVAGILVALVTGDQAAIDRSDWDVFRATGVSHLMSISGLHVTLLVWLVAWAVGALWRLSALWGSAAPLRWPAPTVGALSGLGVALAYALFSGWGVPAQRTVWMLAVATLLRLSAREMHWRHAWGLAAVVVVVLDPWALLQNGFWLSFVAVGVLLASPRLGGAAHGPVHLADARGTGLVQGASGWAAWAGWTWAQQALLRAWGLWREQALITLALLPLSVLFFGQFSLIGLLTNLLAIPWVTWLVTPLALSGLLWPGGWDLAAWAMQPLLALLDAAAAWRGASVAVAVPPWPLAVVAMAAALVLVLPGPRAWRIWGVPLLLPALLWPPPRPAHGHFELLAADVGQGTAVLLRTAGHSLLYDAGPRYSPESDAGHRVLLPLLQQSNERLDVLMLSHRDSDHTGGAAAVLAMQPHVQLWSSLHEGHPLVQGRGQRRCEAGQRWVWDGVLFELLHPLADATANRPNALSCVLRVQALEGVPGAGAAALLTGDVEAAQEQDMLARGLAPVDLLLVPHHGSKTSSSADWLQALSPRLALVQAGYRNRFGHPAPPVLQRYREHGIEVLDSVHCGAATWHSERPRQVRCERQATQRYWHHRPPP